MQSVWTLIASLFTLFTQCKGSKLNEDGLEPGFVRLYQKVASKGAAPVPACDIPIEAAFKSSYIQGGLHFSKRNSIDIPFSVPAIQIICEYLKWTVLYDQWELYKEELLELKDAHLTGEKERFEAEKAQRVADLGLTKKKADAIVFDQSSVDYSQVYAAVVHLLPEEETQSEFSCPTEYLLTLYDMIEYLIIE